MITSKKTNSTETQMISPEYVMHEENGMESQTISPEFIEDEEDGTESRVESPDYMVHKEDITVEVSVEHVMLLRDQVKQELESSDDDIISVKDLNVPGETYNRKSDKSSKKSESKDKRKTPKSRRKKKDPETRKEKGKTNDSKNEPKDVYKIKKLIREIPHKHLQMSLKKKIIELHKKKMNLSEIARRLQISRGTVYLWLKRWDSCGNVEKMKRSGRPRKTSLQQDQSIIETFKENDLAQTKVLASSVNVSSNTVRRRLTEAGVPKRAPARKIKLTPQQKAERLEFAQKYINFDFSKVIFSNEKLIKPSKHGLALWKTNRTRYYEYNKEEQANEVSVVLWAWMSYCGPGELIDVGGRLNSQGYREILNDVLLPTTQILYAGQKPIHFMHDNSFVHKSRVCRMWFLDHHDQINEIYLPPQSPDLNPVEKLWRLMVQAWDRNVIQTKDNIKYHAMNVWEDFKAENNFVSIVDTMKERLQAVIDADGDHTQF